MSEKERDNLPAKECKQIDKSDNDFIPDDAWPLCPNCLTACHPLQYYCHNCHSSQAINPLTPYMGYVNIWFNYGIFFTMWRKVWYDKRTSIIGRLFYLFMIAMFVPVFLIVGLPLFLIFQALHSKLRKITMIVLCMVAMGLLILFMYFQSRGILVPQSLSH